MHEWYGFGGGMWIFWILVLIAVAWLVAIMARRSGDNRKRDKSALEILEQRYALGEIDRDEYLQKRDDLES